MTAWNPKANEIFVNAAELSLLDERRALLDRECGLDTVLREQVEKLLQAHDSANSFLQQPAPGCEPTVVPEKPVNDVIGSRVGPYKLLQEIGQGGMGTVFMAEQTSPVKRMVALKVIKPGMDTAQVVARFEAELQALALMDHPNIAKVLDAGTTDAGRPYFVMELVKGVTITKYCDEHQLTPRERMELFVPVCQAIQHAHQKGIIHRDLKPSNVMIASYDGRPVPKVIDFGVAKAMGQQLTERTMFTGFGGIVGTLEYMSPEQAEFNALDVDTRSDIYSLGVLLYELLTGSTPLTNQRLKKAAITEVLRLIREEEPPKPSTRLTESGDSLASISAQRHTEPAKLMKLIRGDLDWIVMKSLEKDRSRRYDTANGLARDIERYLHDEPVEASPPSVMYRFRKLLRKHRGAVAAVAAIVTVLVLGMAVSSYFAVLASTNAKRANEKAADALASAKAERIERDRAETKTKEVRRLLYNTNMKIAQTAWQNGRIDHLLELLEASRPKPDEEDLRGFEWSYWTRSTHSYLLNLKGHTDIVTSAAFSLDGKRLASACVDGMVKLWDATSGQEILTLKGHTRWVTSVAFSADGKWLASASDDQTVKLWDATSGQEMLTLKGHTRQVTSVAFSADGKWLASASHDQTVKVWDATNGRETLTLQGGGDTVVFSPDGKRLASAFATTVKVWDATSGQETLTLQGNAHGVRSVAFSADGRLLASAGDEPTVKVWDTTSGEETLALKGHTDQVWSVTFSADGKRLASASWDHTVKVWNATSGQEMLTLKGHTDKVMSVAFSTDEKRLASAGWDRTVKVWDATSNQEALTLKGHTSVAFSADGRRLASAGFRTVKVWDTTSGQETLALKGHDGEVTSAAFSPDGKRLVSASSDGTVKVWDTTSGQETLILKGHVTQIQSVAFSPDGKWLASASEGESGSRKSGEVKLWDATSGQEALTLKGHTGQVYSVTFSADGKRLASASSMGQ